MREYYKICEELIVPNDFKDYGVAHLFINDKPKHEGMYLVARDMNANFNKNWKLTDYLVHDDACFSVAYYTTEDIIPPCENYDYIEKETFYYLQDNLINAFKSMKGVVYWFYLPSIDSKFSSKWIDVANNVIDTMPSEETDYLVSCGYNFEVATYTNDEFEAEHLYKDYFYDEYGDEEYYTESEIDTIPANSFYRIDNTYYDEYPIQNAKYWMHLPQLPYDELKENYYEE